MAFRSRYTLPLIVLGILAMSAFGGVRYYTRRPSYALSRLGVAIAAHDSATALRYLDTKATSTQLVDAMMVSLTDKALEGSSGENGFAALGQAFALTMIDKMKPSMVLMLDREMRRAIVTPVKDTSSVVTVASRAPAWMQSLIGHSAGMAGNTAFLGFGATTVRGDSATIAVRLRQADLDTTVVAQLALARRDGDWRVVGVPNITEMLKVLSETEGVRLAAANAPIVARMKQIVGLGTLRSNVVSLDQWGISQRLSLRLPVTNRGTRPIQELSVRLVSDDTTDASAGELMVLLAPLAPGESAEMYGSTDYNRYMPSQRRLLDSPDSYAPRINYLVVGADTAVLYKTWAGYRREHPASPATH